ncbi:MAG: undecaprenyl diphosphate synthase [Acidimicrobiaceae bacterium]
MRIIEEAQFDTVREGEIPTHVGCIMDGNGRWALMRGLIRIQGHQAAEESVVSTVDAALDLGIEWLSVYAFSTENWARDGAEVRFLMSFDEWLLRRARRDELNDKGVRIRFVGRLDDPQIPQKSRDWLLETEDLTKGNDRLQLCIAFNYGGRAEIVDAVRALAAAGQSLADLTEDEFSRHLYVPEMPDIDLVIRTSAEHRLSNFFIWHSTYAEFVFTETLWPDFRGWHLYSAVAEYQTRRRRMGAATVEDSPMSAR